MEKGLVPNPQKAASALSLNRSPKPGWGTPLRSREGGKGPC